MYRWEFMGGAVVSDADSPDERTTWRLEAIAHSDAVKEEIQSHRGMFGYVIGDLASPVDLQFAIVQMGGNPNPDVKPSPLPKGVLS